MLLQGLRHLDGTSPVGIGLDHAHHLRLGLEEGAEVVEVVHDGVEVDLEDGLVYLLLQLFGDALKAEGTRTLQQHNLVVHGAQQTALQELLHVVEEVRGVGQGVRSED